MNELSTKITRLDLDFILDNCFKPSLWDKVWTIFAYDGWKITFQLASIDVKTKKVSYRLESYKPNKEYTTQMTYDSINFQKEHRNLDVIQKGINGKILRWIIELEERTLIKETNAYKEALNYENDYDTMIEDKAKELLNDLGITNSDIRDAYIDSQVNKYSTSQYTDSVLELYKGTKLTKLYMAYALFSNDKENYEKYKKIAKLNGFKVGDLRKEIKGNLNRLEIGEMQKEIELDEVM